jgi:hypothetical protein
MYMLKGRGGDVYMYVCMYIKRREEGRAGMRMLKGWWWGNIYIYIYIYIYMYIYLYITLGEACRRWVTEDAPGT